MPSNSLVVRNEESGRPMRQAGTEIESLPADSDLIDSLHTASVAVWQRHVNSLSTIERQFFEKQDLDIQGPEAYVTAIQNACHGLQETSRGIKYGNWIRPIFKVMEVYTPVFSSMSSASPSFTPTPLVLGAITCIMQISSNFGQYQEKLGETLEDMIFRLSLLLKYEARVYQDDDEIQETIIDLYGDILQLCRKALRLFIDDKGKMRGSGKTFLKSLTGSFDSHFDDVKKSYQQHLEIFKERAQLRDRLQGQEFENSTGRFQQAMGQSMNSLHQFNSASAGAFLQSYDMLASRNERKELVREQEMRNRERENREHVREEILDWLPSSSFARTHDRHCDTHLEGTCEWFFKHELFQSWTDSTQSAMLWVKGKAGCGKSVLASQTVKHLDIASSRTTYVYCNDLISQDRSSSVPRDESIIFLGSILKQLCLAQAEVYDVLEELYKRMSGQGKQEIGWQTLRKALSSILSDKIPTTLIVDGLDECQETEKISKFLVSLTKEPDAVVKLIVFSRPNYWDIETQFSDFPQLSIDSGANEFDINAFIKTELEGLGFNLGKHKGFLQRIREAMLQKADGMFLWVKLVAQSLKGMRRQDELLRSLDSVPMGLTEIYDVALKQIYSRSPSERDQALDLLLWTTNARRPLSSDEMLEAVAVQPGTTDLDGVLALSAVALAEYCADLIFLDNEGCFHLVHASLKEYLKNLPADGPDHILAYREKQEQADKILGEACLTYLLFDDFREAQIGSKEDLDELRENHEFLKYASCYWALHLDASKDDSLGDLVIEMVNEPNAREICLQVHLSAIENDEIYPFPSGMSILHWISTYGLVEIAGKMPELGDLVSSLDGLGRTPLDCAMVAEHRKMCMWLLKIAEEKPDKLSDIRGQMSPLRRAAVNSWDDMLDLCIRLGEDVDAVYYKNGRTALHLAAQENFHQGIKALLAANANLEIHDPWGDTPLIEAARNNHERAMEELLNAGAKVAAKNRNDQTALHFAALNDNRNAVDLVLRYGGDPNCRAIRDEGRTPLHLAASVNSTAAIQSLYRAGADLDITDNFGRDALHVAVSDGYLNSAKLLLSLGSGEDTKKRLQRKNWGGYTPLHIAAADGREDIAKLLVEYGAPIESKNHEGLTALCLAVSCGYLTVTEYLLESGADVGIKSLSGRPLLNYAALKDNTAIFEILMAKGLDIERADGLKVTPLHVAALNGHLGIVRKLTESLPQSALNSETEYGGSALDWAAGEGHLEIVETLLQYGAQPSRRAAHDLPLHHASFYGHENVVNRLATPEDLSAKGESGNSPLHCAAESGHDNIVKLLLARGADINANTDDGKTPLLISILSGHETTAEILLAKNADIKASTSIEVLLFNAAVSFTSIDMVKTLLTKGADPLAKDSKGRSAFFSAVTANRPEMVNFLLEEGINGSKDSNEDGNTCAHIAAGNGNVEILDILLGAGLNEITTNDMGNDPLRQAASSGHSAVIDQLLQMGCDIEGIESVWNPLQIAVLRGYVPLVEKLLSSQAQVDSSSAMIDITPLSLAAELRRPNVIARLIAAGADLHKCDDIGFTPLDYAQRHTPTLLQIVQSGISIPSQNLDDYDRRQKLTKSIISLTKSVTTQSSPQTQKQQLLRRVRLFMLCRTLLHTKNEKALEVAKLCCMELYYNNIGIAANFVGGLCDMCAKEWEDEDVFVCMWCDDVGLCRSCYTAYVAGGAGPRTAPKGFSTLESLEKEVKSIEECCASFSHSPKLLLSAFERCPILLRWLDLQGDSYIEWDDLYNSKDEFENYKQRGGAFVKAMKKARSNQQNQTRESRSNKTSEDSALAQECKLMSDERKLFKEFQDFVCEGHDFLEIKFTEWKKVKEDGFAVGEDGLLHNKVLEDLLDIFGAHDINGASGNISSLSDTIPNAPQESVLETGSSDSRESNIGRMPVKFEDSSASENMVKSEGSQPGTGNNLSQPVAPTANAENLATDSPPQKISKDTGISDAQGSMAELRERFLDTTLDPYAAFKLITTHKPHLTESQELSLAAARAANFISSGSGTAWLALHDKQSPEAFKVNSSEPKIARSRTLRNNHAH